MAWLVLLMSAADWFFGNRSEAMTFWMAVVAWPVLGVLTALFVHGASRSSSRSGGR